LTTARPPAPSARWRSREPPVPRFSVNRCPETRDRLDGYREAAEAAGFPWDDVLIAVCAHNDVTEAEQITAALLTSATPPDAIAAMSD
jgi:DNA-binding LacI/PurR family transcriptional regulator